MTTNEAMNSWLRGKTSEPTPTEVTPRIPVGNAGSGAGMAPPDRPLSFGERINAFIRSRGGRWTD